VSLALAESQKVFARALIGSPDQVRSLIQADSDRLDVYRNNVAVGFIAALQQSFPVTARLVGDEFFRAMARAYWPHHLPTSSVLLRWGDDFPDFIATFAPAESVPYLADVARLEAAWTRSYHSREAIPLDPSLLCHLTPSEFGQARLAFHPSVRLVRSQFPIAAIWAAHQAGEDVKPIAHWRPEDVLAVRPGSEVLLHCLPASSARFVMSLLRGRTISDAAEDALTMNRQFDLFSSLIGLFQVGAIIDLK